MEIFLIFANRRFAPQKISQKPGQQIMRRVNPAAALKPVFGHRKIDSPPHLPA
jgi:hypothetical protein